MARKQRLEGQARQVRTTSVGWMLKRLSSRLDAEMKRALSRDGLNINQFAILMTLLEGEGLTQVEIGLKIGMPGYATTRNIDALERKRLLERRPDERSRRSHRVYLTDAGRAVAPKLFATVRRVNEQFLRPLDDGERDRLVVTLEKLLEAELARGPATGSEDPSE